MNVQTVWHDPVWSKVIAGLIMLALGAALAWRKRRRSAARGHPAAEPATVPVKPISAPVGGLAGEFENDMRWYFAHRAKFCGRLAEKADYEKSVIGRRVRWRGYVVHFNEHAHVITLRVREARDSVLEIRVTFPLALRDSVRVKHQNDEVEFTGVITGVFAGEPEVQGETLELIL